MTFWGTVHIIRCYMEAVQHLHTCTLCVMNIAEYVTGFSFSLCEQHAKASLVHMCVCIYAYVCKYIFVCIYVCVCMCMCVHARVHIYIYMYICMHAYVYVCVYACVYVCICVCM